jgi:hypothetical protein
MSMYSLAPRLTCGSTCARRLIITPRSEISSGYIGARSITFPTCMAQMMSALLKNSSTFLLPVNAYSWIDSARKLARIACLSCWRITGRSRPSQILLMT